MDLEPPKSNNTMLILSSIIFLCIFCICILTLGIIGYFVINSDNSSSTTSNSSASNSSTTSASSESSTISETNSKNIVIPNIPGIVNIETDSTLKPKQLTCKVVEDENNVTITCSHPENSKTIKLISGRILTISSSEETDSFNKITTNYYILVPYIFIVDFVVSLSLKEIEITSVEGFNKTIDELDKKYHETNIIPDKCLKVSLKIRNESKEPYNTTCFFFPGLSSIGSLANIFRKTIIKEIPINILTEYYNIIDKKLQDKSPTITIFEYVMYIASMNLVKNTKYRYFAICNSKNNIEC